MALEFNDLNDQSVADIVGDLLQPENQDLLELVKAMEVGTNNPDESFMWGFDKKLNPPQRKRFEKILRAHDHTGWSGALYGLIMRAVQRRFLP